jgi:hypothetical protein
MLRALLTVVSISLPLLFSGCAEAQQEQEGQPVAKEPQTNVEQKDRILTEDIAKRALLAMDEQPIPPGVLVPKPKDEPIQRVNADEISIGNYHCNLKEKTFHASAFYPNADRHRFNEVSGVFERAADGKWVAKVTKSSSGH